MSSDYKVETSERNKMNERAKYEEWRCDMLEIQTT